MTRLWKANKGNAKCPVGKIYKIVFKINLQNSKQFNLLILIISGPTGNFCYNLTFLVT